MTLEELKKEAERVRETFLAVVATHGDGKTLAKRYDELQLEIAARTVSGNH